MRFSRADKAWIALTVAVLWCAQVASAAGETTGGPYFGDLGQAVMAMVVFAVLLVVLARWAWKPLIAQLRRREESIARTISDAQKSRKDAEALLAEYRARLEKAGRDAAEVVQAGAREAEEHRKELVASAAAETRKAGEEARAQIDEAKRQAMREIYDAAGQLVVDATAGVLRRRLTDDDRQRLLRDSLEEIRSRAGQ